MNIHEYQAKLLLRHYGVPVSDFNLIESLTDLEETVANLQLDCAVVKIQVHAGGRGKSGGVKVARSREEILSYGKALLGMRMINHQTGPEGIVANQILLTPLLNIVSEFYMSAVIDRKTARAMLIVSSEGGIDIEEIAEKSPEKILKLPITSLGTLRSFHLLRLVDFMGWQGELAEQGKAIALGIAKTFVETDASLVEINPLVKTSDGLLIAIDAKMSIDDNALFRQEKIALFYDPSQLPKTESEAKVHDLAYIALDGNIGCMVNGAGLAMATMDLIYLAGGKPANFLDVGGGASEEKVAAAFKILLLDPKVKGILVNIFGGIMNCETLASGIVEAAKELKINVPVVVRMEGTNVEKGRSILKESKLNIMIAQTLTESAESIVSAVRAGE